MRIDQPTISGSVLITGSLGVNGNVSVTGSLTATSFTGSLLGTSSYALSSPGGTGDTTAVEAYTWFLT